MLIDQIAAPCRFTLRNMYSRVYSLGMGTKKSGKLTRAPLFFALAMLRFEDQQIGSEQMSQIHNSLKADFPLFNKNIRKGAQAYLQDQVNLEVSDITEYHASNEDRTISFMLRNDGFFFQTIEYETYVHFRECLKNSIEKIHDVLGFDYYQAVGIRYVDYIKRSLMADIREYVQAGLMGFSINNESINTIQTSTEMLAEHDDYFIRLRCSYLPGNQIPLPADLMDSSRYLDLSKTLSPEPPTEHILMLDTDCFQKETKLRPFDLGATLNVFDAMHRITSQTFKAAITDEAWDEWK